jgi:hypothetical protein
MAIDESEQNKGVRERGKLKKELQESEYYN